MLETRAIVIHVQGQEASVRPVSGGGCGHCNSDGGCGSGKLSQLFCSKPRDFTVHNEAQARVGDEVQIALPDGVLLRSSIRMYVVPLVLLLAGGIAGAHFAHEVSSRDLYAVSGAGLGLLLGFIFAKYSSYGAGRPVLRTIITSSSAS